MGSDEPDFAQLAHDIYERQGNMTDVAREAYEFGVQCGFAAQADHIAELEAAALPDGHVRIDGKVYEVMGEMEAPTPTPDFIWNRCLVPVEVEQ